MMASGFNYQEKSYLATKGNELKRKEVWQKKECQNIYNMFISYSGGAGVIRKGMRSQAKQKAITCFLNSTEPDYEAFKQSVAKANTFHQKRGGNNK